MVVERDGLFAGLGDEGDADLDLELAPAVEVSGVAESVSAWTYPVSVSSNGGLSMSR